LYHALMEALIEDENAMEKEVAVDKVKDHKRKHDSDDDEGPLAGSNQDSEQSTKNKLDSNASAAQLPPTHTSFA
ncbi:hypothetical protein Tco_0120229, partial [Tanacetum coccineum]